MRVTVNIPDAMAAEAHEKGLSVEALVELKLVNYCKRLASEANNEKRPTIAEAAKRIRQIGKGNQLDGENIKD